MGVGYGGDVQLLMATFVDGPTAGAILLAMAFGLSLPNLLLESLVSDLGRPPERNRERRRAARGLQCWRQYLYGGIDRMRSNIATSQAAYAEAAKQPTA
jgi:hypothetical protein